MQRGVLVVRSIRWSVVLVVLVVAGAGLAAGVALFGGRGDDHASAPTPRAVLVPRVVTPPIPPVPPASARPVALPPEPPIEIVATVDRARIRVGDPLPVTFAIRNRSDRPVAVLPSLDNSDNGVRYPIIDIEIRDRRGRRLETPRPAGCGWINRLTIEDFRWLAPGQTFDLFGGNGFAHYMLDWRPAERGHYTVKLVYDLRFATMDDAALGFNKSPAYPDATALVPLLPRGLYESELIEIDVR